MKVDKLLFYYTSIDPKQFQNDSFRPILVKHRFLGTPYFHPKSKLLHQWIFVGIDIAICSATLSHRVQGRGQDKDKRRTRPSHRAQHRGQEEEKSPVSRP